MRSKREVKVFQLILGVVESLSMELLTEKVTQITFEGLGFVDQHN